MSTSSGRPDAAARPPARPASQQPAYSEHARSYDRDTGAFQPYREAIVEALPLRQGQVVLDVGCGTGLCCGLLREKVGPRGAVVGIEEAPEMAAVAREHIACEGWHNVTVVQSPARDAQIAVTADAALFCAVHDILQSRQALRNVLRSLRRTQDPLDPGRPGRLNPLLAAPGQQRQPQPVPAQLGRADLGGKPVRQLVLIADRWLAESQRGPDLRPVILDRAARPGVLAEHGRIDLDLARHEIHRRRRQFARVPGKPRLLLEVFQRQREPQPGRPGLVRDQPEIALIQRPALDEVFQLPLTAHADGPSSTPHPPATNGTSRT